MAKQPAALRRYWAEQKRGGGKSKSMGRRSSSKAIVVRAPAPIVVRTTTSAPAKRHHGGGRRHRGGGGGGGGLTLARLGKLGLISGVMGYTVGDGAPKKLEILDKLPTIGKLPAEGIIAGGAYLLRHKSPWLADLCLVATIITGNKLGKQEFKLSGFYG